MQAHYSTIYVHIVHRPAGDHIIFASRTFIPNSPGRYPYAPFDQSSVTIASLIVYFISTAYPFFLSLGAIHSRLPSLFLLFDAPFSPPCVSSTNAPRGLLLTPSAQATIVVRRTMRGGRRCTQKGWMELTNCSVNMGSTMMLTISVRVIHLD